MCAIIRLIKKNSQINFISITLPRPDRGTVIGEIYETHFHPQQLKKRASARTGGAEGKRITKYQRN